MSRNTLRRTFNKDNIRVLVGAIISLGGIFSVVLDYLIDCLPETLKVPIMVATVLSTTLTLLISILDNHRKEFAIKINQTILDDILERRDRANSYGRNGVAFSEQNASTAKRELLRLISVSMHKSESRLIDQVVGYNTDYYIHTLATAHSEELCAIMTQYLCTIVNKIRATICDDANTTNLFYLIVPYGRNIIVADKVAKQLDLPILISQIGKLEADTVSRIDISKEPYEYFYNTFLGFDTLRKYIQNNGYQNIIIRKNMVLNGIILDCNVTSGSGFALIANHFNCDIFPHLLPIEEILFEDAFVRCPMQTDATDNPSDFSIKFNKIKYSATLFLAHDHALPSLITNIKNADDLKLMFFFELNEDAKISIFNEPDIKNKDVHEELIQKLALKCKFKDKAKTASDLIYTLPDDAKRKRNGSYYL